MIDSSLLRTQSSPSGVRTYDIIGFGDEVPGVFSVVTAAREYRRRTNKYPRILLLSKGNLQQGIGGHLIRGKLAYLDRSQIEKSVRDALRLDTFGDPPAIYKEFLQKAGVRAVALDPAKGNAALKQMLAEASIDYISNVGIKAVNKQGNKLISITILSGQTFSAKQFIDATVNAELAQAAQVEKLKGFATFGLPESELAVTLVFETKGLTITQLKNYELQLLKRFTNFSDIEAQKWLWKAAGNNDQLVQQLRKDMVDAQGNLKSLWVGPDDILVRSPALSVAYHSFRNLKFSLYESGMLFDKANIAILPDGRLSWNCVLFPVTAAEAEILARNSAKPTSAMLSEMNFLEKWFKSIGATELIPASELYIRHAGNVTGVVEPLDGANMLMASVSSNEALGTFGYHFDVRGGIKGFAEKAYANGFTQLNFQLPVYNVGFQHTLIKNVRNLAVVSPCSGFTGMASGSGRIVEYNSGVGQALGIAAITALLSNRNLADITNQEVRRILLDTKRLPRIFGIPKIAESSKLAALESSLGNVFIA
ncbi:FAD-dependent oxidoreductase [[Phormidium ambiguum] IAM M-71]|uniref:FAD-dependent oxidoreductase n=1 Tax=[Phormidium ambiguum] IAM M-71 TaxID=454136 RepID=UPI001F2B6AA2|nr:FAD-dependent oxidoreductase [Phormidium ambiguum]